MVLKKKCRRARNVNRKINKFNKLNQSKNLVNIFGTNANSLLSKMDSLLKNIKLYQPLVFFIQESKVSRPGQIKIPSYQIFEVVRQNSEGGSILTAIHESLNPVYVCGGEDGIEILVIQAEFGGNKCRLDTKFVRTKEDKSVQEKLRQFIIKH